MIYERDVGGSVWIKRESKGGVDMCTIFTIWERQNRGDTALHCLHWTTSLNCTTSLPALHYTTLHYASPNCTMFLLITYMSARHHSLLSLFLSLFSFLSPVSPSSSVPFPLDKNRSSRAHPTPPCTVRLDKMLAFRRVAFDWQEK